MAETFAAPLGALLPLPDRFPGVAGELADLFASLALEDFVSEVTVPPVPAGGPEPQEPLPEEEALAGLEWFDDEPEEAPDETEVPQAAVEAGEQASLESVLRLRLRALAELSAKLEALPEITLAASPGAFEAVLRTIGDRTALEVSLRLATRVDPGILRPVRRAGAGYEPDPGRPPVEAQIAAVRFHIEPGGVINVRVGGARIVLTGPVEIGTTGIVVERGDFAVEVPDREVSVGEWASLFLDVTIRATDVLVATGGVPDFAFQGDAQVAFAGGALQPDRSFLRHRAPGEPAAGETRIEALQLGAGFVALRWRETRINAWLGRVAPELADLGGGAPQELTLRILFGGGVRKVRLDWRVAGGARTLALPGVRVTTPPDVLLTLLLGAGGGPLTRAAFLATWARGAALTAGSDFAWFRMLTDPAGEAAPERELQSDPAASRPLLSLSLTPKPDAATLVLLDWDLARGGLPTFLQELAEPLRPLDFGDAAALATPTPYQPRRLSGDTWHFDFAINLPADYRLPLLGERRDAPGAGLFPQALEITAGRHRLELEKSRIAVDLDIRVRVGGAQFSTTTALSFDWERFAIRLDDDAGIHLESAQPEEGRGEHLGLAWRVIGAPVQGQQNRFRYFTLGTARRDYRLSLATDARLEVEYARLGSGQPLVFVVDEFSLSGRGVSLAATVDERRTVRLNGVDTHFRFTGTRLVIRDNRIADFTLSGSGPLPRALVGEGTADIDLQFAQRDGTLRLVAGSARLKGKKLLESRATRFRFSVDGLGLRFVDDGRYHLYFTLTGSAEFVPGPADEVSDALGPLSRIRIELVDCPLAGDARVLSRHIRFLIELPRPKTFRFLDTFEMELRGIGFIPQADVFGGDAAMLLGGQVRFADGPGDAADPRADLHRLFVGVPAPGKLLPRIHFRGLPTNLAFGEAFKLAGSVQFLDTPREKGFTGEGVLQVQGLPTLAASFAFLRARRDENSPWVRAWFLFVELRQVSFGVPVLPLFIREVGLGFGYRYTLVSIREADRTGDAREQLKALKSLARTQGDLSNRDRWALDLEEARQDARWTVALRALFSQTTAAPSPLTWNPAAEARLSCLYLFDATVALRSDLTFLMVVRGWINTNYHDYVTDAGGTRARPLVNGFVLLSPRRRRFLANVSSNPDGRLGDHPAFPEIIQKAVSGAQFTATLLLEPGLLHFELGWPNMLRWQMKLGPFNAEFRGGFLFRMSRDELVIGSSYLARATLSFQAGFEAGLVGARLSATASLAYGARYIGVLDFSNPLSESMLYGAIGVEIHVRVSLEFWIGIKIFRKRIRKTFRFSFAIDFTAGLEVGIVGISPGGIGLRGTGTIAVRVMGRRLALGVRIGINEGAVNRALDGTRRFLNVGLEATDVEAVPGVAGSGSNASGGVLAASVTEPSTTPADGNAAAAEEKAKRDAEAMLPLEPLSAPGYSAFVLRGAPDGFTYFVIFPQGEKPDGDEETGFLPVPPRNGSVQADFRLRIPLNGGAAPALEHFDPLKGEGDWEPIEPANGVLEYRWRMDWDAVLEENAGGIADPENRETPAEGEEPPSEVDTTVTLREYLRGAFVAGEEPASGASQEAGGPLPRELFDPFPLKSRRLEDERVQTPSDSAYEAAARGAAEQFRGSPFFKRDLSSEYGQVLEAAFRPDTTVFTADGKVPDDPVARERMQGQEQAHHVRGMVIHDLVADVRGSLAMEGEERAPETIRKRSIAFRSGLVFRVPGDGEPAWLREARPAEELPEIRQRLGMDATGPSEEPLEEERVVRPFNLPTTDFSDFPPQFRRLQVLSDADTIAMAWEMAWDTPPDGATTAGQKDPEHHLMHYVVRRRALEGTEPETVFTVCGADALHGGNEIRELARRFQLADHFTHESPEELAALPAEGRSYLYTITPVDYAGKPGRPLTVVGTRRPNVPPLVPTDAEVAVPYAITKEDVEPRDLPESGPPTPPVVEPGTLVVRWTEPSPPPGAPRVPVDEYRLVFRREETLPVGSYGLDGGTQGPRARRLPSTSARPLPTDVSVRLDPTGRPEAREALVPLQTLRARGIFPGDGRWRPEAWRVFIQTVSLAQVPSALAPVQLALRVAGPPRTEGGVQTIPVEERRPADLEWIPEPVRLPLLTPRDERVEVGTAHVPMPAGRLRFDETFMIEQRVLHRRHPQERRCIRLRWNQGPSGSAAYPLDLNAGYHLLELDADAHTDEAMADPLRLPELLRHLQEVQMIPADELALTPGDTLAPQLWEAWYPSAVLRRTPPPDGEDPFGRPPRPEGSEVEVGPWYSWRESRLEWPAWPGFTDGPARTGRLHPFLEQLLALLTRPRAEGETRRARVADVQVAPPQQPGSLADFFQATAPTADPYGWAVLQRFGLSVAFTLRDEDTGEVLPGKDAVAEVRARLADLPTPEDRAALDAVRRHLHVELLFQPGASVQLRDGQAADPRALLSLLQVSLRPALVQDRRYAAVTVRGTAAASVELSLTLLANQSCTGIDRADPGGAFDLSTLGDAAPKEFRRIVRLPSTGRATLLFRGDLPAVAVAGVSPADATASVDEPKPLAAVDEGTTEFRVPETLAAEFAARETGSGAQWVIFKKYVESLGSSDPTLPDTMKLTVPTAGPELERILPDFLAWSQRFFDASGGMALDEQRRGRTADGPWTATAYPRAGTPAYATPDDAGRLRYDHLLDDRWAHAYRYYVRPYGRYERLWEGLRQSATLFPEARGRAAPAVPDPAAGGLDVVLERTHPVAAPLVLSSRRLDPPAAPARAAPPGGTWEVIVAQHPEQSLVERNQTLARQLAYQQIAFTLLRRFAYPEWVDQLRAATQGFDPPLRYVEDVVPDIPAAYPTRPDHLGEGGLDDDERLALDLPLRIPRFQQGAMVLRWPALPFFYEHRLVLVAQATDTVSPMNEVVQRDFGYVTPPTPLATVRGAARAWTPDPPFGEGTTAVEVRARELRVPLPRLWDSVRPDARDEWPFEDPDASPDAAGRTLSSLPDPEVVYEVVEEFSGTVEVQAELFFDPGAANFSRRQLGRRWLADVAKVQPPGDEARRGDYVLLATLQPMAELELAAEFDESRLPEATRAKVALEEAAGGRRRLRIAGTLAKADHAALRELLAQADRPALDVLFAAGWSEEPVSAPVEVPAELADHAESTPSPVCTLVWHGDLSPEAADALRALPGDDEFRTAAARLAATAGGGAREMAPLPPEPLPPALREQLNLEEADGVYTRLEWSGPLSGEQREALRAWTVIVALANGVDQLLRLMDDDELTETPPQETDELPPTEIPDPLRTQLTFTKTGITWRGAVDGGQLAALGELAATLPETSVLAETLRRLADRLRTREFVIEIDVPRRPRPDEIHDILRPHLVIGCAVLRYHGVMTPEDAQALASASAGGSDGAAVARLYAATLRAGTAGRRLSLRARRGSAFPADPAAIEPEALQT